MAKQQKLTYDKWEVAEEAEQKKLSRSFIWKASGMLWGYVLFIIVIGGCILYNIFLQELSIGYIGFFLLVILAAVAGMGNTVKTLREMKNHPFLVRDGYVRKINYANKRRTSILSYEVEVNERNVIKTIVVTKAYRAFHPKMGDRVLLARPERTHSIYFYRLLSRAKGTQENAESSSTK
jgi:hypothetical protein